jgi:hypothetical protein
MKKVMFAATVLLMPIISRAGLPALDKVLVAESGSESIPNYKYALTDLNVDGIPDAVVFFSDPVACGLWGCSMSIYRGTATGFVVVSDHTPIKEPIYVLSEIKSGWHTISVRVSGGGVESMQTLLRFNGKKYPRDPTYQKQASSAHMKSAQKLVLK